MTTITHTYTVMARALLSLFLTIHALLREIHIAELLDPKCEQICQFF